MHCYSADLALAAIKENTFQGTERFVISVSDYQRYKGLGGLNDKAFWELWGENGRELGHLTAAGLAQVAEYVEYALYRAILTSIQARNLPLLPAPSDFELSPNRTRIFSFFLPSWGEIPDATFQVVEISRNTFQVVA